jgi:hypothetical protein
MLCRVRVGLAEAIIYRARLAEEFKIPPPRYIESEVEYLENSVDHSDTSRIENVSLECVSEHSLV